jgi:PAS domain S-box-containing protein
MLDTSQFFDSFFENARQNSVMILNNDGLVQKVNNAFTTAYGHTTEDLRGKHFRVLYTEKDQTLLRPEIELNILHREGSSSDENYLVHKDGTPIWVTGESILVETGDDTCIMKVIHNIHAQKQLERYLLASTELLDGLFNSVQSGLLVLDGQMRTIKINTAFRRIFNFETPLPAGSKISDIPHEFWAQPELKEDIRKALIHGERLSKEYIDGNDKTNYRKLRINSKIMLGDDKPETRLLLVVKEL